MVTTTTAIGEVLPILVSTLTAALAPVLVCDGMPISLPADQSYLVIGGDIDPSSEIAQMQQEWRGLGLATRYETLRVNCTAVGRDTRTPAARARALAVVQSVGVALPVKPTSDTYNAVVSNVDRVTASVAQSGVTVKVAFTITVNARLL